MGTCGVVLDFVSIWMLTWSLQVLVNIVTFTNSASIITSLFCFYLRKFYMEYIFFGDDMTWALNGYSNVVGLWRAGVTIGAQVLVAQSRNTWRGHPTTPKLLLRLMRDVTIMTFLRVGQLPITQEERIQAPPPWVAVNQDQIQNQTQQLAWIWFFMLVQTEQETAVAELVQNWEYPKLRRIWFQL